MERGGREVERRGRKSGRGRDGEEGKKEMEGERESIVEGT